MCVTVHSPSQTVEVKIVSRSRSHGGSAPAILVFQLAGRNVGSLRTLSAFV